MKNSSLLLFLLVVVGFWCCVGEDKVKKDIENIPIDLRVNRFDQLFARATVQTLPELKKDFSFLFPKKYDDSIWINKLKDTLQQELNMEVSKVFPDFLEEEERLKSLLRHIKYYFPEVTVPNVITITSDVDYRNKVVLTDNLLIISLDTYLGEKHHFYDGIPVYLRQNFKRDQIMPDIATMYAKQLVELPENRTFLANLVYYGKEMFLKNLFLPADAMEDKMGYTEEELQWVKENEEQIWRYFIDKELLYSTNNQLLPRFLFPAPFSKFYLEEIDKEAPDRVGRYIGWRIVASYMKNNNVSLRQLMIKQDNGYCAYIRNKYRNRSGRKSSARKIELDRKRWRCRK